METTKQTPLKFGLFLFTFIFLIGMAGALGYEGHPFETDLNISFTSNNATSCNLTKANTPYGELTINQEATKFSQTFSVYILGSNFTALGNYCFNIECTDGAQIETGNFCRTITPSGSILDQASSITLFGSLLVMIIVGLIFLFVGLSNKNVVAKISFVTLGIVVFIMVILYMVVTIQQVLYGFEGILSGMETFLMVMKVLFTVGILGFFIVVGMVMLKAWKIKRGLYDE